MLMNLDEYTKEKLWQLLVEAVHASVMYPTHKAYTRDSILPQKADVTANELSERLGMPLGEALVILSELTEERKCST
jgi:transcription initiation factor IIE alpha subunit